MGALASTFDHRDRDALRRLRKRYHVLRHDGGAGFVAHDDLPAIMLDNGGLMVGAVPIHAARFTADHITWRQQSPGRYSSGHLYVHNCGLSLHGVVRHGTCPADAARHDVIGTAVKPVRYRTRITKDAYPRTHDPARIADGGWDEGYELAIWFEPAASDGDGVPAPQVWLDGVDITPSAIWSVAANGNTVLTIAADDRAGRLAPQFHGTARLSFNPCIAAPTGSGTVCAPACGGPAEANVHFWIARPAIEARQQKPFTLERISAADVVQATAGLSVEELMTILPHDAVAAADASADAVPVSERPRDRFAGEGAAGTTEADPIALINESLGWYRTDFAQAYLPHGLGDAGSRPAPAGHRLDAAEARKLDDWFTTGLAAAAADFSAARRSAHIDAIRRVHEKELDGYLNDGPDGGAKWARALFDALTSGPQLALAVARIAGAVGDPTALAPVNNFATLLTALQPSAEIARAYYKSVLCSVPRSAPREGIGEALQAAGARVRERHHAQADQDGAPARRTRNERRGDAAPGAS